MKDSLLQADFRQRVERGPKAQRCVKSGKETGPHLVREKSGKGGGMFCTVFLSVESRLVSPESLRLLFAWKLSIPQRLQPFRGHQLFINSLQNVRNQTLGRLQELGGGGAVGVDAETEDGGDHRPVLSLHSAGYLGEEARSRESSEY